MSTACDYKRELINNVCIENKNETKTVYRKKTKPPDGHDTVMDVFRTFYFVIKDSTQRNKVMRRYRKMVRRKDVTLPFCNLLVRVLT